MKRQLFKFILLNIIILVGLSILAYQVRNSRLRKSKKPTQNFWEFINNGTKPTLKSIGVGLMFGIIFGFIDNFGLWIGLDELSKYMPGGLKTKAALGNTYSDAIGAILGVYISIIIKDIATIDEESDALWINPIGIIIGCLIGLFVGNIFFK
jgi:hypothetical protein